MAVATPIILSDGKPVEGKYELHYLEVVDEVNRIPRAFLEILDGNPARGGFQAGGSEDFALGRTIEILLRMERSREKRTRSLFKGIVTSQTLEADADNTSLVIELKHSAVRLTQGRKNRVFPTGTDRTIFDNLFKPYTPDLAVRMTGTPPKIDHDQMVQYHCTDWDFLLMRAEAIGKLVRLKKEKSGPGATVELFDISLDQGREITLTYGIDDILQVELKNDVEHIYRNFHSSSWDPGTGTLKEENEKPTSQTKVESQIEQASKAIGTEQEILQNAGFNDQENRAWAKAAFARSRMALLRGRIQVEGRSDIEPGDVLILKGFSGAHDGKALVTGVKHTLSVNGWDTDLQLGLSERWFHQKEDIMAPPAGGLLPGIRGLHLGTVEAYEKDPRNQYRVKVKLPLPYPAKNEKDGYVRARLASFYAGAGHGAFFFPEPGDEVVVGFINDDPRHAVILGSLYSSKQEPPPPFNDLHKTYKNVEKGIIFNQKDPKKAIRILFHDEEGNNSIKILDGHGNEIVLNQDGITLTGNTIDFQ